MTRLSTANATLSVSDGRVSMVVDDADAGLYFDTPDRGPLSKAETHATIRVTGDDYDASIELDAAALDALADQIYHAQEAED